MTRFVRVGALITLAAVLPWSGLKLSQDTLAANEVVNVWMTTSDRSRLLQPQASVVFGADTGTSPTIDVNEANQFQTMDGFGASLTDSSAGLINRMTSASRTTLLNNLFSRNGSGIGLSVLRNPMGGSDFSGYLGHYNYDNSCCNNNEFSINAELAYIVPIMQQIRGINPELLIMGVPWSPPGWMKTSNAMIGGSLRPEHYGNLGNYFVRWIQQYESRGLPIYAVIPQNEPQFSPTGYPGMLMTAGEQANFIRTQLAPQMQAAGHLHSASNPNGTKIIIFDHNWSIINYPTTVLNDAAVRDVVAGSGFHCYGGTMSAQTTLHNSFPGEDIWHTECSDGEWIGGGTFASLFDRNMREMVIGVVRNWAKGVTKWNLALDPNNGPTSGGCPTCIGTVTINGSSVTYNAEYYWAGHASKFVMRGARRIQSNETGGITNVAFRNPDGSKVVVAYNTGTGNATFKIRWAGQAFTYTLPGRAAATFVWNNATGNPTPTPTPTPTPGTGNPTPTPTPTPGTSPINPAAWYQVVNQNSNKCADVANSGTANAAPVQQWACTTGLNQQWQFRPTSGGYYQVVPRHAQSLSLDVTGGAGATGNGALMQLWAYGGGNNQQFLPQSAGTGLYRFVARHSGRCVEVSGSSIADGVRLQQWDCNNTTAQSFRLVQQP